MQKTRLNKLKMMDISEINDDVRSKRMSLAMATACAYLAWKHKTKELDRQNAGDELLKGEDETTQNLLKRALSENNEMITQWIEKYSKDLLEAAVLFQETILFSESSLNKTPEGVSKLARKMLLIEKRDRLLDLGMGVGSFLFGDAFEQKDVSRIGVELNTDTVNISTMRSKVLNIECEIVQGNMISQDYSYIGANKVFSNFPLGMSFRLLERHVYENEKLKDFLENERRSITGDWVYTLAAINAQKEGGRTVVIMTNGATWNQSDIQIRRYLLKKGLIEGVIQLPERLFSSFFVPVTMMIFSSNNKKVKLLDASDFFTEGRRQNSLEDINITQILDAYERETDYSRLVEIKEILEEDSILNPQRYVSYGKPKIKNPISLGEISNSINRGATIRSSELDELASLEKTKFRYLMLKNIEEGKVDSNLPYLTHIEEKHSRYCLGDGNLIISRISPFKIARINMDKDETILANGNLFFIDLNEEKMNPLYVELFLQSEAGLSQLHRLSKGAAMKTINISDLQNLQIPDIPRGEQDKIAESYQSLQEELVFLNKQIEVTKTRIANLLEEDI